MLGSGLMAAIREQHPEVSFTGIGGAQMTAQGLDSMVPMERLSVMGLIEPLKRLPELLRIRKNLLRHFLADPPDVFIGIDSPDFNLGLERRLRQAGILTVHYVSPSVWAWRQKRVHKIERAADLMLTLFPFEAQFYAQHQVQVAFVGHPLADLIPLDTEVEQARRNLALAVDKPVLALLPGSRSGELARLLPEFIACARLCQQRWPDLQLLLPCANAERRQQVETYLEQHEPSLGIQLFDGKAREVMAAADAILIASGTATLEALLLKKPMLVCYRMNWLSYRLISGMLKVPYFSLPNLLAGKRLVNERVQDAVQAQSLYEDIVELMEDSERQQSLNQEYYAIHRQLKQGASSRAAQAVLALIKGK